jgi:hypothetical protein
VAARAAHFCLALMTRRRHGPGGEVPTGNVGSAWAAWLLYLVPCAGGGLNFLRVDLGGPGGWRPVPFGGSRQKVPCPWPPLAPGHGGRTRSIAPGIWSQYVKLGYRSRARAGRELRPSCAETFAWSSRTGTRRRGLLEGKDGGERVRRRGRKSRRAVGMASKA